jgi:hypothetical protein
MIDLRDHGESDGTAGRHQYGDLESANVIRTPIRAYGRLTSGA